MTSLHSRLAAQDLTAGVSVSGPLEQAIADAVGRRTRPILLTTLTTVAGLLPMTLTQSTLWPPMAWSIISGLSASTLLTLMVVPAMCAYLLREGDRPVAAAA
mgnify:CR=1 FL=1